MLVRRLWLLAAFCLLSSAAGAQTYVPVTVSSAYGIGLTSVVVTNLATNAKQTCNFTLTPNLQCKISNVQAGQNLQLVTTAKTGFIVTGGTGQCGGITAGKYQFAVAAGGTTCQIFAGYPLTVTGIGGGLAGAQASFMGNNGNGPHCAVGGGTSCQIAVQPGSVTLTIGLKTGYKVSGGTGLCSKATGVPFAITIPAPAQQPYNCGINTGNLPPPTVRPQAGWWWTATSMANQCEPLIRYGLQINTNNNSLYGVVLTFRQDGSPVWYLLNAVPASSGSLNFLGTASEYTTAPGSNKGAGPGAVRLLQIVANVQFTFSSPTAGTLVWTPRSGGSPVTLQVARFPISPSTLAAPPFAPTPGAYASTQDANAQYFLEMQGTASAPYAHIGAYSYNGAGQATWSVSNTSVIPPPAVTAYPSSGAQTGWQVKALLQSYSGGAPLTSPQTQPTCSYGAKIIATLTKTTNSIQTGTGSNTPLAAVTNWGLGTSPYWLQIVNNSTTLTTPYVTFFPAPATPNFSYVSAATGQLGTLTPFTSIPLSSIANGALAAPSTAVNGDLYISSAGLQVGNTTKSNCTAISPSSNAAPSLRTNSGDCNLNTPWQFVELGGDYDVTYINLFSIPFAINQGSASKGNLTSAQVTTLATNLAAISGNAAVYPAGSLGQSNFVRIVSPANATGANDPLLTNVYKATSFNNYIAAAFKQNGQPTMAINIANSYSAPAKLPTATICSGAAFKGQTYSTNSISYSGNRLTLTGKGSQVGAFSLTAMVPNPNPPKTAKGCGLSYGPAACYTPAVTPANLSAAFYNAVIYYSVANPACKKGYVESNGANDVFSLVMRDFLVGFASGFVDSSVASPIAGKTYGQMTSGQWSNSAAKLFNGVQPSKAYYNPWGSAVFGVFGNDQVYGFQYSDYFLPTGPLSNPLLTVLPSIPVQLVIQQGGS